MGLKVRKQNKIIHFSFIKVIKMYNDKFFLEKLFGFMNILHINKPKIKLHSKQTYDKNKTKHKSKTKLFNKKNKNKKKQCKKAKN
jgi:hypothetical protein